ncbi:hypothetical protein SBV1_920004 [Verrucomicrobia bacterium]|nr:hypothetical protein SBV1_920004 [Verrucomicrobiota bacterium]
MAYIVRVDDTQAAVFSNCEQVRLLQDEGQGWEEAATKGPETMFLSPSGQPISYALKHPPFQFTVAAMATALRAEGLIGGNTIATNEWRRYGTPVALQLEADRPVITADGADLSRIIVTAVDTNGTPVDNCSSTVTFSIDGLGQLIGENPVKLRAGRMIILAQSAFVPGQMKITARSERLRPAEVNVKTTAVPPGTDLPKDLRATQPTPRRIELSSHLAKGEGRSAAIQKP